MADIRDGKCPKCGSTEVYKSPKFDRYIGKLGAIIPFKGGIFPKYIDVIHYVCGKCSYLESFVLNQQDLRGIRLEWEQVSSPLESKKKNDEG